MLELGLFWFGAAVIVVALLMLFINAFQQNKVWGIAGLVLLVPLLVHILLAWNSLAVRKATYALIIGVLAILVSIAGGALKHLPFLSKHEVVQTLEENIAPPKDVPLPNEEQAKAVTITGDEEYDPVLSGGEFEEVDVEKMVPPSTTPVHKTAAPRYHAIQVEELSAVINKRVRLTMANGEFVNGTLTNIQENAVTIESAVEGGSLGLSYNLNQIDSIAVQLAAGEEIPMQDQDAEQQAEDVLKHVSEALEQAVDDIAVEQGQQEVQVPLQENDETLLPPVELETSPVPSEMPADQMPVTDADEPSVNENMDLEQSPDIVTEP